MIPPWAPTSLATARNSARSAKVPGMERPSGRRCCGRRLVEKADRAFLHRLARQLGDLSDLVLRRGFLHRAFAHDVEPRRAVPDEAADVDGGTQRFQGVEIATVGLPVPGQAVQDRLLGDVLDGLHHPGEELPVRGFAGREGDAAIAEQRRRDAVASLPR